MIIGAVAFLPGAIAMLFSESKSFDWSLLVMQLVAFSVFCAPILLALGMLGLRTRYGIGGGVLLFGAVVGGMLVFVGLLVPSLTTDYSVSDTYYYVWLGGVYVLYLCLAIFGILALIQKPLPRWNWLPLIAGASLSIIPLLWSITEGQPSSPINIALLVLLAVA